MRPGDEVILSKSGIKSESLYLDNYENWGKPKSRLLLLKIK